MNWIRIRYRIKDVYYGLKHVYLRVIYQWFTPHLLIKVKAHKMYHYSDMVSILPETVFQLFINYCEREEAWCTHRAMKHYLDHPAQAEEECALNVVLEYHAASRWDRWKNRDEWNRKFAIAHWDWEMTLDHPDDPENGVYGMPSQAANGKKKKELYLWLKDIRPNRIDPWDAFVEPNYKFIHETGGFTDAALPIIPNADGNFTMRHATPEMLDYYRKIDALEEQYEEEDTQKAIEILQIRQSLWT